MLRPDLLSPRRHQKQRGDEADIAKYRAQQRTVVQITRSHSTTTPRRAGRSPERPRERERAPPLRLRSLEEATNSTLVASCSSKTRAAAGDSSLSALRRDEGGLRRVFPLEDPSREQQVVAERAQARRRRTSSPENAVTRGLPVPPRVWAREETRKGVLLASFGAQTRVARGDEALWTRTDDEDVLARLCALEQASRRGRGVVASANTRSAAGDTRLRA